MYVADSLARRGAGIRLSYPTTTTEKLAEVIQSQIGSEAKWEDSPTDQARTGWRRKRRVSAEMAVGLVQRRPLPSEGRVSITLLPVFFSAPFSLGLHSLPIENADPIASRGVASEVWIQQVLVVE